MGMFDTFLIDHGGETHEVQTKRFANALNSYRPGDLVDDALPGIRTYFIRMQWDEQCRLRYADDSGGRPVTFFIVLVSGIFTASEAIESYLDDAAVRLRLDDLKTAWSDTARCMARWGEFLATRQTKVSLLNARIGAARSLIDYAQKPEEKKAKYRRSPFYREEEQRIDQGENVLEVLLSVLESEVDDGFCSSSPRIADALDKYRL